MIGQYPHFVADFQTGFALRLKMPFLGAISQHKELRINSDSGNPTANFTGDPELKKELEAIVRNVAGQVSIRNLTAPAPVLNVS